MLTAEKIQAILALGVSAQATRILFALALFPNRPLVAQQWLRTITPEAPR